MNGGMQAEKNYADGELIAMIKDAARLDAAITFLYRQHFEILCTHIEQNQGSRQDAEDIFQEALVAFINLVQKNKFRGEAGIKTFLFAINKNMWLNELKRRGRAVARETIFENEKQTADPGINNIITGREARLQMLAVMDKLGETCRKILLAFYYENLAMKEIVKTMDYENEQVLRNKKYKCLKNLEQLLTNNPLLAQTLKAALQYEQ
jgi:RNA polymerase sigma factor (sigma-70 family)